MVALAGLLTQSALQLEDEGLDSRSILHWAEHAATLFEEMCHRLAIPLASLLPLAATPRVKAFLEEAGGLIHEPNVPQAPVHTRGTRNRAESPSALASIHQGGEPPKGYPHAAEDPLDTDIDMARPLLSLSGMARLVCDLGQATLSASDRVGAYGGEQGERFPAANHPRDASTHRYGFGRGGGVQDREPLPCDASRGVDDGSRRTCAASSSHDPGSGHIFSNDNSHPHPGSGQPGASTYLDGPRDALFAAPRADEDDGQAWRDGERIGATRTSREPGAGNGCVPGRSQGGGASRSAAAADEGDLDDISWFFAEGLAHGAEKAMALAVAVYLLLNGGEASGSSGGWRSGRGGRDDGSARALPYHDEVSSNWLHFSDRVAVHKLQGPPAHKSVVVGGWGFSLLRGEPCAAHVLRCMEQGGRSTSLQGLSARHLAGRAFRVAVFEGGLAHPGLGGGWSDGRQQPVRVLRSGGELEAFVVESRLRAERSLDTLVASIASSGATLLVVEADAGREVEAACEAAGIVVISGVGTQAMLLAAEEMRVRVAADPLSLAAENVSAPVDASLLHFWSPSPSSMSMATSRGGPAVITEEGLFCGAIILRPAQPPPGARQALLPIAPCRTVGVYLCAPTQVQLDSMEANLLTCLHRIRNALLDKQVLQGGGELELLFASHLASQVSHPPQPDACPDAGNQGDYHAAHGDDYTQMRPVGRNPVANKSLGDLNKSNVWLQEVQPLVLSSIAKCFQDLVSILLQNGGLEYAQVLGMLASWESALGRWLAGTDPEDSMSAQCVSSAWGHIGGSDGKGSGLHAHEAISGGTDHHHPVSSSGGERAGLRAQPCSSIHLQSALSGTQGSGKSMGRPGMTPSYSPPDASSWRHSVMFGNSAGAACSDHDHPLGAMCPPMVAVVPSLVCVHALLEELRRGKTLSLRGVGRWEHGGSSQGGHKPPAEGLVGNADEETRVDSGRARDSLGAAPSFVLDNVRARVGGMWAVVELVQLMLSCQAVILNA
eukprot:jgi/Mesvir1/12205/Mv00434-RA.1